MEHAAFKERLEKLCLFSLTKRGQSSDVMVLQSGSDIFVQLVFLLVVTE